MRFYRRRFTMLLHVLAILSVGLPLLGEAATNAVNKVIIYPSAGESVESFRQSGSVSKVHNYGAYWLAEASDAQLQDLRSRRGPSVTKANYLNRIELNAASVDTSAGETAIPDGLRESAPSKNRLRIVQFNGPILPQWLDQIKKAGNVQVVNYVPNNSYLVRVDQAAETALTKLMGDAGPIQWMGPYHPFYKMPSSLANAKGDIVKVRVNVVDSSDAAGTVAAILSHNLDKTAPTTKASGQISVAVTIRAADLQQIAHLPDVLWIEPVHTLVSRDEKQDLISAERISVLPGHAPVAPNLGGQRYLDFLTNTIGFSQVSGEYPILDIADTGLDNGTTAPYHPCFYQSPTLGTTEFMREYNFNGCPLLTDRPLRPSRVAYAESTDLEGHGTFVASVACGMDDLEATVEFGVFLSIGFTVDVVTGNTCCEGCTYTTLPWGVERRDAQGFNLGMGVSPFGNFGVSLGGASDANFDPYVHGQRVYLNGRARISNNSWGEVLVVGSNDGGYDSLSQNYDALVRDAVLTGTNSPPPSPFPLNQELIYVFAAGNANGAAQTGGFGDILVTPPCTAKNVIAVGASQNVRNDCLGLLPGEASDSILMSTFTSYGPTSDGRVKPEIVAPGSAITGALTQYPESLIPITEWARGCDPEDPSCLPLPCTVGLCGTQSACGLPYPCFPLQRIGVDYGLYSCGSGTSFSAPQVSGAVQLLWWYFQHRLRNEMGQHFFQPSPAMARAYLVNSARYLPLTNPQTGILDKLPSIAQGFGIMDLQIMFDGVPRVIRDETTPRAIDTPLISTNTTPQQMFFSQSGQAYTLSGKVADPTKPFKVTLAWSDAPGTPGNGPQLVNDLDLVVSIGGKNYKGNAYAREFSDSNPQTAADSVNNIEVVSLPAGQTGTWTAVVRAINIAGQAVPNIQGTSVGQDYALVVYNGNNPSDLPNPKVNNSAWTATAISTFPYNTSATLSTATYHKVQPTSTCGQGGPEAIYKIENPTLGVSINANTYGSNFDTVLSVWKGLPGALVEVTCNDNTNTVFQSEVTWSVNEQTTYYLIVQGKVTANGQIAQGNFNLQVQASQPPIGFIPNVLNFGGVLIGSSGPTTSVMLTNGTQQIVNIAGVSITGPNASQFQILSESCSGSRFVAGATCQIDMLFTPQGPAGAKTATLVVTDDATGSPQLLELDGTALDPAPVTCASANGLSFGTVDIGSVSAPLSVTITNCGTSNLVINAVTFAGPNPGDFRVSSNNCTGNSIPPGGTCAIGISFAPTLDGIRLANLNIADNTAAGSQTIALNGSGRQPVAKICAGSGTLDFGVQSVGNTSVVQSVIITNCGTSSLTISNVTVSGANAADFKITASTCGATPIAAGGTCMISMIFTPTGSGNRNATLVLTDNSPKGPDTIALTGYGGLSQPDALIGSTTSAKKFIGAGVYDETGQNPGPNQTLTFSLHKKQVKVFYVKLSNAGTQGDTYTVRGGGDVAGVYSVQYFLGISSTDGVDITSAMEAGTYNTGTMSAGTLTGDASTIRVVITVNTNAAKGTYPGVLISATSTINPTKHDSVKANVAVR